ncbi:NUDIX hydrolase [Clostridium cellulovorans]|uniref:NUDIX hydrolase n=1 Tax=Clostridium cellulovorans (strain ATCC 35296 / DSM 3052 / OCM 3 / 743B) TaxID=573061 RepID=D9SQY8_CLOC7|nr:NUDIX domain-containing protein [Clostridium cellulovorans]ADL50276.1 NUDIX hydrolase [Clostridium cellulovorans 743B]
MNELWDLYDKNRKPLNKTQVRGVPLSKGEYHLVVDIWTINSDGKILIDKRHSSKKFGGLWECTGGSVIKGEDSVIGALRELEEELGIKATAEELILIHSILLEDRFVDTYILKKDIDLNSLVLQADEVTEVRFVTLNQLDELCHNNMIVIKERYGMYRDKIAVYAK